MSTGCCIVGGGPAGIIAGYLLARAGVDTIVVEKHADFNRDFRGDTLHPSTLRIIDELGDLDELLQIPHSELRLVQARFGGADLPVADFHFVPGRSKFLALMPQWDLLDFCAARARRYATFRLLMQTHVTDLIYDAQRVVGIVATTAGKPSEIRARLVIAADGRNSILRQRAALDVIEGGAPIDVLWMRLSKRPDDPPNIFVNVAAGGALITLDRLDYYQCACIINKAEYDTIRSAGLAAFRDRVAALAPFLADRVAELRTWDEIKLLTVRIDRLRTWHRPGILCIGDAAHAMSPIGGVGINLAIGDGVAVANLLAEPLLHGSPSSRQLSRVQRRRALPARLIATGQTVIARRYLQPLLASQSVVRPPFILRLLSVVPWLQRIPAYVIGIGFRAEHVKTRERR